MVGFQGRKRGISSLGSDVSGEDSDNSCFELVPHDAREGRERV